MKNFKKILIFTIFCIILIVFDRYTKFLAQSILLTKRPEGLPVLGDLLWLLYLENTGAAFGMLKGQMWFFFIIAILMAIVVIYVLFRIPDEKKYLLMKICLCLILSGGIGNMIDRMVQNYVIDFFYIKIIDFAIFNVADIYITVGTALLIIDMLFFKKDEDLGFLKRKKEADENNGDNNN